MSDNGKIYLTKSGILVLVAIGTIIPAAGLLKGLLGKLDSPAIDIASKPWENIRLPDNLIPTVYNVDLRPIFDLDEGGRYLFRGSSSVTYICKKATNYVIMHSLKLNYTANDVIVTQNGSDMAVQDVFYHAENEFVIIETEKTCVEGKQYQLTVSNFVSELSGDLHGLYRSEYDTRDGTHKIIATSQMEPTGARETFPCFDEPALKANFTVTLWYKADTGEFALSNMPPASYQEAMIDGILWNSTTFQESVPMSTYLLALVVCDFSYVETFSATGVQTRIYSRSETIDNGEADYAAEITPKILDFFESYFSVHYPLPKSDQIAVPDFSAGAMENWGLIIYRETYLLYSDSESSIFHKKRCTNVISHELAHNWFGNLVSPAWWDDIWLNEGFATYVSFLGEAEVQPSWKSMGLFLTKHLQTAFALDALTSSHPLVQPVNSPSEIHSQFDGISYSKGSSIIQMINSFTGERNFVDGLTKYLNNLKYGSATHGDLFRHWEDQANEAGLIFPVSLTKILETWTLQMGYPVVNVVKHSDTNQYILTQEYFLLDSDALPVQTPGSLTYGYKWYIPFTYKTFSQIGTNSMTELWMEPNPPTPTIITEAEYILANVDAVGYYRVNYDDVMWKKLSSKLNSASFQDISENNRAQLMDDAFNLARATLININIPMDISLYLTQEEEYAPWKTFTSNIKFIEYMIGRTLSFEILSNYVLQLIEPRLYLKYGWNEPDRTDTALIPRTIQQLAIASVCHYGSEDCIKNAKRLYKMWMNNPEDTSIISNTYRSDVYCAAIRNGGLKEWNFAWKRHNLTNNAQEQSRLRYGMACSDESRILSRYIEYCFDPTHIRRQDSLRGCLFQIAKQESGRDLVWNFVVKKWDYLLETYGSGRVMDTLIAIITRKFSTEEELQKLEDFKSSANFKETITAVDRAIEQTKANIKWRQQNEESLTNWLNEHFQ